METPLESEFGSAGFMYNLVEHPESIRAVAARLLANALDSPHLKPAQNCQDQGASGSDCAEAQLSHVVYRVAPTAFLEESEQQAICLTLEEQTKSEPFHFPKKQFASVQELNDWIMEFSQGRGEDGRKLYEQCSANCSPRYTFFIDKNETQIEAEAEVLCGLARDRSNDQYSVATSLQWQCLSP